MIKDFDNHLPVRVRFGDGVAASLPALVSGQGWSHVFVIVDEGLAAHNPAVAALLEELAVTASLTIHEKPPGEPTIASADAACTALAGSAAEVVIAIGGGSVMDTAKAARSCVQQGVDLTTFLGGERVFPEPDIPMIAVPTTAGTGSEVSGGAVFTDPARGVKAGIAHPNLRATWAFVDPRLTHTMPPAMTAHTGIDALAQAIAAVIARVSTPIGDAIAFEAVRLIGRSLTVAYRNPLDVDARSEMMCAATMAGLAMNISDCTAEHSLGQAIGGLTGAPHGLTVGLVLAETLERERHQVPELLERVADALGAPPGEVADGSRCVDAVRRLLQDLDFPVLSDLELTPDDSDRLARAALDDYFITMSPATWTFEEVRAAFDSAFSLARR
ncbi:iron-containing alcohol dehydrogenase [Nocardioides bigeumensis]|uniref:Iron-containing alcohol dehydrogenase n=1 Tax=Nocardioides bigeumensis TaxID=433657 RepID=A0ABP5K4L5_9ACTN